MKNIGPLLIMLAVCVGATLFAVLGVMVLLPVLLEMADASRAR